MLSCNFFDQSVGLKARSSQESSYLLPTIANMPGQMELPRRSVVENAPAMQETPVRSLGWEDPLDEEMVTHSSILDWRVPWAEEPGGLQSMGLQSAR